MTNTKIRLLAAIVVLIPGLLQAAPSVAVVNIAAASEKYAKTTELEAQFDALRKKIGQERDAMKEKIDRANRSLQEEIKPGTDEFRKRKKEIALMEAELQWFVENEGQKVEKGLAESLKSIFDDIQTAAAQIAEEKRIDIVLASDKLPPDVPDSAQQLRQHILLQKVIYWNPSVDLTEEVIARLNANYKRSGGSGMTIDQVQIKPKDAPAQTPPK